MNLSSRNLKLIIGVFYLLILFFGLYYLFSLIDIRDLTSYEFIKSNKEIIIDYKNNNFLFLTIIFFLFSIVWYLLLGFASPILLFSGFVFGKWYGILIAVTSATIGTTLLYLLAKLFFTDLIKERLEPKFSSLKIVSRYIDPQIRINAEMSDNIYFHENIENIIIEYQKNDVFVMPSIIEGFGYVYLEALSQGLFCIGTKNSGLKDISTDKSSRIIETGDIENLSNSLNELQDIVLTKGIDREMIKSSIKDYTWENYREKVSNVCKKVLLK